MADSLTVLVAEDYRGVYRTYTELAGLRPLLGGIDSAFTILGGTLGERSLSLFQARPGREAGLHHIGIEVHDEDDLDRGTARMKERGIVPEFEIDHPMRRCIFLRDPCGQLLQFYVDRNRAVEGLLQVEEEVALYLA